jgi:PAS domain S-box-containing protein
MNDPQLDRARGDILIVNDILSSQRALSAALMEHGYEVRSAPDGPTALMIADTDPPDLILLDVFMPEMDGYQVCQQLKSKAQTRDIPIIFVSALDEVVDKARGFEVGGVDYVTKPFQKEELMARVETHLALQNAQKQIEEQNVQFEREIAKGRRAEEALVETVQLLEAIFDRTPMLVACLDPLFNFVRVNRAYAEADGRDPFFFPGKNYFDLYPYADNEAIFRRVIETGKPYFAFAEPFEYAEHPERGVSYWDWTLVPVKDSAGTPTGLVFTLANVTDRVQTREALGESEERYRTLVEDMPALACRFRPDGVLTFVNEAYCQYFGQSRQELEGQEFSRFIPEQERKVVRKHYTTLTPDNPTITYEHQVLAPGGTTRWQHWTERALFDKQGRPVEYQSIGQDIAERKRAEEELQRRIEELTALNHIAQTLAAVTKLPVALEAVCETVAELFEAASAVIAVVGAEQAELETLARWTRQPMPAEAEKQLFPLVDGPGAHKVLSQARTHVIADMQAQDLPATVRKQLRSLNLHAVMIVPLQVRGTVIGMMGIGKDQEDPVFGPSEVSLAETIAGHITAAIENTRLYKQAQAVAIDEERQRLAHELHDVVTQALFSASLIAETLPRVWERYPEKGRPGLEELRQLTQGALTQTRTMLLELRPGALAEQELGALIRQLTDGMRARTRMRVTTTVVGECSLPTKVKLILYRIAQEALNNIIKHAGASQAKVYLHCEPGQVTLSVSDNGRGFDPDSIECGRLGLGIMRERAKAISAEFRLESQRDRGTEITVTWEKAERDERPDTKPEQVPGE